MHESPRIDCLFGSVDNSYLDIDNFAHQKTESNNCFIIDFKPKKTNMARKTIKIN